MKTKEQVPKEDEKMHTTIVSLDAVSQQLGKDGGDGESSLNDVISNTIKSLFNPNEPFPSSVSILPSTVGGQTKLCIRLPASKASAFLMEGGIPKKMKIVIP